MRASLYRLLAVFVSLAALERAGATITEVSDSAGNAYFVIDATPTGAADDNYSEPSPFGGGDNDQTDSWNGNRRWGNDGISTAATWAFDELPEGSYTVYASWRNIEQGNVSIAHYTGSDSFVETDIDQRPGAGALAGIVLNDGANDINFASLGGVDISDADFALSVDDSVTGSGDASTFIFADAIAIGPIPREDSDGDGMPDAFEDEFGLLKNDASDAGIDGDEDGLTNLEEYQSGSDPTVKDSDGDGLEDGPEVNAYMTDPADRDSDDDGLEDGDEIAAATDPNNPDSDADGNPDGNEVSTGSDPLVPDARRVIDGNGDTYLVIDNGIVAGAGSVGTGVPVDSKTFNYSENGLLGGQDVLQSNSWNGDRRWANGGASTSATWSFDNLPAGTYSVYASWINGGQANISTAHYSFSDGADPVDIDQRPGAESYPGIVLNDTQLDINFANLGSLDVIDGTLEVSVDDSVTGPDDLETFIIADAIAIGPVNNLPPATPFAVIEILYDPSVPSATITWNSKPGLLYVVDFSADMKTWSELNDSVESGGTTTDYFDDLTTRFSLAELPPRGFYRVSLVSSP